MRIESIPFPALSAVGGGNLAEIPSRTCDPWLMMFALLAHHYAAQEIIPIFDAQYLAHVSM